MKIVSFSITRMIICGRVFFSNSTRIEGFWDEDDIPQPHQNDSNRIRMRGVGLSKHGGSEGKVDLIVNNVVLETLPPGSRGNIDSVVNRVVLDMPSSRMWRNS